MHEMGITMKIVEIAISSIPDDIKNARSVRFWGSGVGDRRTGDTEPCELW
jgi:hypothetical protein